MSLFVDLKFVGNVAHLLRNFKRKADYLYNFSCPICGDSKKNKFRARGYLFRWKDGLWFKCHKCGIQTPFSELIKTLDVDVHKEYTCESFLENKGISKKVQKEILPKKTYKPLKPKVLSGCSSIASLAAGHPARVYVESRMLPAKFLKELFWTDDFPSLVDKVNPDHGFKLKKEGRIIIPFLDRNFELLAIQGRALGDDGLRYITIKAFEDAEKLYGQHRLGKSWKRVYIVEGPFDSMFLANCLAMAGGDIPVSLPVDRVLVIYDNEPRKPETCSKIEKAISKGYRVCIWPDTLKEKDINLMVKAGHRAEKIQSLIDSHSFVGMEATEKLRHWRKDT